MSEIEVYDTLLDVPLDEPEPDGDDQVVPGEEDVVYDPPVVMAEGILLPKKEVMVVPFRRVLKPGSRGRGVIALKRSLSHAHYLKWIGMNFSPVFGPRTGRALKKFKQDNNLSGTPVYGREAHKKLARFYDSYSIRHLLREIKTVDDRQREAFLAELMYVYNRR